MRRRHNRRRRNNQRKIIILSIMGLLLIMVVGYSAFQTNLNINVKGNIKDKSISTADLTKSVVTDGDGLYEDSTESGRYVFRGSNPNNYINIETTSGTDVYRIVSIESDGTAKIIKDEKLDNTMVFDTASGRYSSSGYCNSSSNGCNAWGSSTTMLDSSGNNTTTMARVANGTAYTLPTAEASLNTYLNSTYYDTLSSATKSAITNHIFNVGPLLESSGLATNVSNEKTYKWKGYVGLINPTDYVKASTDSSCSDVYVAYDDFSYPCQNNNYLYKNYSWWTISPVGYQTSQIWYVANDGRIDQMNSNYSYNYVRPVLYLSSDIKLLGSGTETDAYTINS